MDRIASRGYIVFRIDYRGHDQSEGEPTGAYGSPGYFIDVMNAMASLQAVPPGEPVQTRHLGPSMGGYLSLQRDGRLAGYQSRAIWAGVVGSYPDMIYNWRRTGAAVTPSLQALRAGAAGGRQWLNQYGQPRGKPRILERPLGQHVSC